MKSLLNLVLFVSLAGGLAACSGGGGQTSAQLRITGGLMAGNYTGMFVGRHSSGKRIAKKFLGADTQVTLELPNGDWEFGLISWDTTSDPDAFEGTTKCYHTTRSLNGQAVTLDAVMTDANCGLGFFGGANAVDGAAGFKTLVFQNCLSLGGIGAFDATCGGADKGFHRSFRISLAELNEFTNTPATPAYTSVCYANPAADGPTVTPLRIPIGSTDGPFGLVVTSYVDYACGTPGEVSFVRKGLRDDDNYLFEEESAVTYVHFQDTADDFLTRLSSQTASGSGPQPKPLVTLTTTTPTTYIYHEGTFQTKIFFSQLETDDVSSIFFAPANAGYNASNLIKVAGKAYFTANEASTGVRDLYSFDGVSTTNLTNYAGGPSPEYGIEAKLFPSATHIYFVESIDNAGVKEYRTCAFGLVSLALTCPGTATTSATGIVPIGVYAGVFHYLQFDGTDWHMLELDGVSAPTSTHNLGPSTTYTNVQRTVEHGGKFFVFAQATPENVLLKIPHDGSPIVEVGFPFMSTFNNVPFLSSDGKLYSVYGASSNEAPGFINSAGTHQLLSTGFPSGNSTFILGELNGKILFVADTDTGGVTQNDLYSYDGTSIAVVADHTSGIYLSSNQFLFANNKLFFAGASNGQEPWVYDGTTAVLLKDINPGASSSNPLNFVLHKGTVYFTADDGTSGVELWKTDGTTAGTVLLDLNSGSGSSNPTLLRSIGDYLYFFGDLGAGQRLLRSDGTVAGTHPQFTIAAQPFGSLWFNWEDRVHLQLAGPGPLIHHFIFRP